MRTAGNFRRRRRSNRAVKLGKPPWTTRARQIVEAWPLRFLGVVLGVALTFRLGIGWARALVRPEAQEEAAPTATATSPRPPRLRADGGGTATAMAILGGRARALGGRRAAAAPSPRDAVTTREPTLAASPSFLRARRDFEHRHPDDAAPARPAAPRLVPVSGRPRARRE